MMFWADLALFYTKDIKSEGDLVTRSRSQSPSTVRFEVKRFEFSNLCSPIHNAIISTLPADFWKNLFHELYHAPFHVP